MHTDVCERTPVHTHVCERAPMHTHVHFWTERLEGALRQRDGLAPRQERGHQPTDSKGSPGGPAPQGRA